MFDTHAHLADKRFDADRAQVIESALNEGISGIICICSDFERLKVFSHLIKSYDLVWGAVGVHPHDAIAYNTLKEKLDQVLKKDKIVALGEIGLDYYYKNSPPKIQKEVFSHQLSLAKKRNLPVIIHSREAMKDTLKILQDNKINQGVVHCFSGTEEEMKICLEMGLYISLAGPLTFPKASNLQKIASLISLRRLVVETDSPYLAPQPVRGKRNQPAFVKYVLQKISFLRGISEEKLTQITSDNAKELFKLF